MSPRDENARTPDGATKPKTSDETKKPKRRFTRRIDCAAPPLSSPDDREPAPETDTPHPKSS